MRSRAEERKEKKEKVLMQLCFSPFFPFLGFWGGMRIGGGGGLNAALNSSGVLKQGKRENTNKCYN